MSACAFVNVYVCVCARACTLCVCVCKQLWYLSLTSYPFKRVHQFHMRSVAHLGFCNANGRRIARQRGGALRYEWEEPETMSLSPELKGTESAVQSGGVLQYFLRSRGGWGSDILMKGVRKDTVGLGGQPSAFQESRMPCILLLTAGSFFRNALTKSKCALGFLMCDPRRARI